jgi:hypothetical protein
MYCTCCFLASFVTEVQGHHIKIRGRANEPMTNESLVTGKFLTNWPVVDGRDSRATWKIRKSSAGTVGKKVNLQHQKKISSYLADWGGGYGFRSSSCGDVFRHPVGSRVSTTVESKLFVNI